MVLGPLLFLVYIDDLDDAVSDLVLLNKFADDTKAASVIEHQSDVTEFQEHIDKLYNWSSVWNMEFNVDKCHILHLGNRNRGRDYVMNGKTLHKLRKEKDLGIQVMDDLKPAAHCSEIARKATATLFNITKAFHFRDKHVFIKLYKQYVRPQLEYAVQAWSPWHQKDIDVLERVQKRMLSFIPCLSGLSYEEKLRETGIQSLKYRRERADMITIYRWINAKDRVDVGKFFNFYGDTERNTRVADYRWNIVPRRCLTEIGRNSFVSRVAAKWNMLPTDVKAAPSQTSFVKKYDIYSEQILQS